MTRLSKHLLQNEDNPGLLFPHVEDRRSVPVTTNILNYSGVRFTTQNDVLRKHNVAIHDNGQIVGMCRAMTSEYVDAVLKHNDTSALLANDTDFLSRSIRRENRQLHAKIAHESDLGHTVFNENNIPHSDVSVPAGDLAPQLRAALDKYNHVIVTVKTGPGEEYHEGYIGHTFSGKNHCSFFDANYPGGEKKGPCDALIGEFHQSLQRFPVDKYPATFGVSL